MDEPLPDALLAAIDDWHAVRVRELARRNHRADGDLHFAARRRLIRSLFLRACAELGAGTAKLRDWATDWAGAPFRVPLGVQPVPSHWLGRIDEHLLGKAVRRTGNGAVRIETDPRRKKPAGVFYTPRSIVDFLVERTLGGLNQPAACRILDPACGGGAFVLAAFEWLLRQADCRSFTRGESILLRQIHGVDVDPQAAETTRLALVLKLLECCSDRRSAKLDPVLRSLESNIRVGDAIDGFDWHSAFPDAMRAGGFDVVLVNPPYGATLETAQRARLAKKFSAGTTDTAPLFMLESRRLTRPGGRCGMIVPKSFVHSSTWRRIRDALLPELTTLLDAGKAWNAVKLEQTAYVLRRGEEVEQYECLRRSPTGFARLGKVPKRDCHAFGFIL